MKKKVKNKDEKGALFIPAGIFLGLGFGFLYGRLVEGLFLGLGCGFLVYALIQIMIKKK